MSSEKCRATLSVKNTRIMQKTCLTLVSFVFFVLQLGFLCAERFGQSANTTTSRTVSP
jgi:hypothetical protein